MNRVRQSRYENGLVSPSDQPNHRTRNPAPFKTIDVDEIQEAIPVFAESPIKKASRGVPFYQTMNESMSRSQTIKQRYRTFFKQR